MCPVNLFLSLLNILILFVTNITQNKFNYGESKCQIFTKNKMNIDEFLIFVLLLTVISWIFVVIRTYYTTA